MIEALAYDDISIVPKHSSILHREDCSTITRISKNVYLEIPIASSPMDTITEFEMARTMAELGGIGFIHRFMSIEKQAKMVNKLVSLTVGGTIGATEDCIERAQELVNNGCKIILIDVAHGHHLLVEDTLGRLKNEVKGNFDIVAGNIATKDAAKDLCEWGVDAVRVGIGSGGLCSTRIQTGVGIPMVTSLLDVSSICDTYNVPVIADGGIRTPGDVAKAIACGADTVMIGGLLSGTKETPGKVSKTGMWPNEKLQKKYRGSASLDAKIERGERSTHVEGYSRFVSYKGKTKRIINDIMDGLRSAMSYVGANTIDDLQASIELIKVTNAGIIEGKPHLFNIYK